MAEVRMAEAASLLGVSVATVWRRLRKGELQGRRGPDGHWLVSVPDENEVVVVSDEPVESVESSTVEVTLLRAELEHSRALIAEVQQHRDDLLRQLEAANVERAELRGLLTQAVGRLLVPPAQESGPTPKSDLQPRAAGLLRGIWQPPQTMAMVAAVVLLVCLVISVIQTVSLPVIVLSLLTLLLIGYLSYLPATRTEDAAKAQREVEQARQRLQQFLAVVARDLEQPLNVVLSYARLLRHRVEGENDANALREVRSIEEAALRMQRLIADFQEAARLGKDQVAVQPVNGNLIEVARQAVGQTKAGTNLHQ